jgi:hypothetical protein
MGILDNDTVIVDAILTKIGRQKLAQGQPLGISKFAFGDTGVDYTLYNPNHPSGSDSYGSAITSLPMLEAVPDDNVFLRSKLHGTGDRNVQKFSFISVENTSPTITKVASSAESNSITIIPTLFPKSGQAKFDFKVLDIRGIKITSAGVVDTVDESGKTPPYSHPNPVIANIRGQKQLVLTAADGYLTQRSFGIEVTAAGKATAAPIFITVTVEENQTLG